MDDFDFEKALKRLDKINEKLSDDETGLDEGMALFEEAASLIKALDEKLAQAKQRMETIGGELK